MRTSPLFDADPRFARVQQAIPDLAAGSGAAISLEDGRTQAAVSLVLRATPELEVLLIRRAEAEADPWSGHMALPGGRRDLRDESLLQTAMRETLEETGVRLREGAVALGRLDPLLPASRRLPPLAIFPFVFGVPADTQARAANLEVDEVLWVPLSHLGSPGAAGTVDIHLGDIVKAFPCLRVDDRVIWGLTYRILQDFLGQVERGSPELLAEAPFPGERAAPGEAGIRGDHPAG